MSGGGRKARGQVPASGSDEDVDMLVMENETLKRDMKDMEGRVKAEIASALEASRAEVKAELAAQIGVLMEALQKAQQGNNGNNGQNTSSLAGMPLPLNTQQRHPGKTRDRGETRDKPGIGL